ncbi:heterokaryon incompatibility domain-containing protein [Trichoderma pleuroticola]
MANSIPTSNLCDVCTDIFAGKWQPQLQGWKRAIKMPNAPPDPFNPEPAFGTAYDHGMEPYVHRKRAPPTLSYPHHSVEDLRKSGASCALCQTVVLSFDALHPRNNISMDYMEGRKPYGVAAWAKEEIAKAKGYVFIYTEKNKTSKLIFRYQVDADWAANRSMDVNPTVGEREGNVKDVSLDIHNLSKKDNKHFIDWMDQGSTIERLHRFLNETSDFAKHLPKSLVRELPTRLLHLTAGTPEPTVRLIDGANASVDVNTPYIALSHSWGNTMPIQLIASRLAEFTSGIAFSDLPATFRDAAALTLELGVSYLWIDSLCIIQDSASDWLHEAQRMASVYAFSHLTIAASASKNPTTGLSPSPRPRIVIVRPTWTGFIQEWGLRPGQTLRITNPWYNDFDNTIVSSPLNRRGWTYQEYALSPRVLHCTDGEWWWNTISDGIYRETSTNPTRFFTGPGSITWPDKLSFFNKDKRRRTHTPDIWFWDYLTSQYNQRALTKRKDKLVAFGAVAQLFGQINDLPVDKPGEYVAGAWRTYLPFGLHWSAGENAERHVSQPGSEDEEYVIPSWSWASIDGLVRFHDGKSLKKTREEQTKGMPRLVDVNVVTEGGLFGPVKSGYIILHGPIFRIRVAKKPRDHKENGFYREFKVLRSDGTEAWKHDGQAFSLDTWKGRLDKWVDDREMYLMIGYFEKDDGYGSGFAILLDLVGNATKEKGVFRRIGSTLFFFHGLTKLISDVRQDGNEALRDGEYIDFDPKTGFYTYKIV